MLINKICHCAAGLIFLSVALGQNPALAGTAQIYSPGGLPKSSTQEYTIPDTSVTPQTFPTPPIPMQIEIQGLSNVPLKEELTSNAKNKADISASEKPVNMPNSSASVDSFFQCPPPFPLINEKSVKANPSLSVTKLLWHTLDNIGVPLPNSKKSDLAPSLLSNQMPQKIETIKPNTNSSIHQKIPESELGVTDIPANDDAKLH